MAIRMHDPTLTVAAPADAPRIAELMRQSITALFPRTYDERQTASALLYVAEPDSMLLEDGTYFLLEAGDELVACGGWSRRDKRYTGSGDADGDVRALDPEREPARVRAMFVSPDWTRRGLGRRILEACEDAARDAGFRDLFLVATLVGMPFYEAYGFRPLEEQDVVMPDGVALSGWSMGKPIEPRGSNTRRIR
jgi:GNAT superfamily N-acetyltransferase